MVHYILFTYSLTITLLVSNLIVRTPNLCRCQPFHLFASRTLDRLVVVLLVPCLQPRRSSSSQHSSITCILSTTHARNQALQHKPNADPLTFLYTSMNRFGFHMLQAQHLIPFYSSPESKMESRRLFYVFSLVYLLYKLFVYLPVSLYTSFDHPIF